MFQAKQTGKTDLGTWYGILQDGPNSFHVSVSKDQTVLYDHFENLPNMEQLHQNMLGLEQELLNMIQK